MSDKRRPEGLSAIGLVRRVEDLLSHLSKSKALNAAVIAAEQAVKDNGAVIEGCKDDIAHHIAFNGRRPIVVMLEGGTTMFAELPDPMSDENVRTIFTHPIKYP